MTDDKRRTVIEKPNAKAIQSTFIGDAPEGEAAASPARQTMQEKVADARPANPRSTLVEKTSAATGENGPANPQVFRALSRPPMALLTVLDDGSTTDGEAISHTSHTDHDRPDELRCHDSARPRPFGRTRRNRPPGRTRRTPVAPGRPRKHERHIHPHETARPSKRARNHAGFAPVRVFLSGCVSTRDCTGRITIDTKAGAGPRRRIQPARCATDRTNAGRYREPIPFAGSRIAHRNGRKPVSCSAR